MINTPLSTIELLTKTRHERARSYQDFVSRKSGPKVERQSRNTMLGAAPIHLKFRSKSRAKDTGLFSSTNMQIISSPNQNSTKNFSEFDAVRKSK